MPSQEIKTKNPLGASDEHMENFAAAFTQCFYDYMAHPDAKERMSKPKSNSGPAPSWLWP